MSNSSSLEALIRDLKGFERRKEVVKALRKEIRQPVPALRKRIKERALSVMPKRGGFNAWLAKTRITARITVSGKNVGVFLKGGRKSIGGQSDIRALDKRGILRAPTFGRKGKGKWHVQKVPTGFFTEPAKEDFQWLDACYRAIDKALDTIRKG
jgi:hypothetical protein